MRRRQNISFQVEIIEYTPEVEYWQAGWQVIYGPESGESWWSLNLLPTERAVFTNVPATGDLAARIYVEGKWSDRSVKKGVTLKDGDVVQFRYRRGAPTLTIFGIILVAMLLSGLTKKGRKR